MLESKIGAVNGFEPWLDLTGKVVMVTGASSGLGRGFCLDLAKASCIIVASAGRIDLLQSLCDEINATYGIDSSEPIRALPIEIDVSAGGPAIDASVENAWDAF